MITWTKVVTLLNVCVHNNLTIKTLYRKATRQDPHTSRLLVRVTNRFLSHRIGPKNVELIYLHHTQHCKQ